MAAEMVKAIMKAEATGREMEGVAEKSVEKMLSDAEIQAQIIIKSAIDQAKNQANIILSDAEYSANGIIKQAEKLAELREKKSIADTEKQYEYAIKLVLESITK